MGVVRLRRVEAASWRSTAASDAAADQCGAGRARGEDFGALRRDRAPDRSRRSGCSGWLSQLLHSIRRSGRLEGGVRHAVSLVGRVVDRREYVRRLDLLQEPRPLLNPVARERGDKGHGFPMAVGSAGHQPFAPRRPAAKRLQIGLRPGLINEHQTLGLDLVLTLLPLRPPSRDVGPFALARHDAFF